MIVLHVFAYIGVGAVVAAIVLAFGYLAGLPLDVARDEARAIDMERPRIRSLPIDNDPRS